MSRRNIECNNGWAPPNSRLWRSAAFFALAATALGARTAAAQEVQIPAKVKTEIRQIEEQFTIVLEEECPAGQCTPVGCEVTRFKTIDERQGSSLPGLDFEEDPVQDVQYRLAAARCSFSHESTITPDELASLRDRVRKRVSPTGVNLLISARRLPPKPDALAEDGGDMKLEPLERYGDFTTALGAELLPFIPWIFFLLVAAIVTLIIIWGVRRLGRPRPVVAAEDEEGSSGAVVASSEFGSQLSVASPYMIMTKTQQLKESLKEDPRLGELVIKPLLDGGDTEELCLVVMFFGPDMLRPFREKPQYEKPLLELSRAFNEKERELSGGEHWAFLGRMERRLVAARIRLDQEPVEDEFSFLGTLQPDELIGLLEGVSEREVVLILSYAPKHLREAFFAASPAAAVSRLVGQFSQIDKMSDAFARQTAAKLRKVYEERASALRTVPLHQTPLLESAINALKPADRKALVASMVKDEPELLKTVAGQIFLDSSLLGLSNDILTEAFLVVPPKSAAAYLISLDEGQDLLDRLNPKLAQAISDHQRFVTDKEPWLADEARGKIAEFLRRKDAEGVIDLGAINSQLLA